MRKNKIVWIEDGGLRDLLAPRFQQGFARDDVEFEDREDFARLKEEIATGELADVYILDNEIAGERDPQGRALYGAQMALKIHDRAYELEKEVLVITMLCSSPDRVRQDFGPALDERDIPILHKNNHVAICGFFIGANLEARRKEGRGFTFSDWLGKEGIKLPTLTAESQKVDGAIALQVKYAEQGGFYLPPRDFIQRYREGITEYMSPEEVVELDRIFPTSQGVERIK